MHPTVIDSTDARYPARLRLHSGLQPLPELHLLGKSGLLALPKTGLFCSSRCPEPESGFLFLLTDNLRFR